MNTLLLFTHTAALPIQKKIYVAVCTSKAFVLAAVSAILYNIYVAVTELELWGQHHHFQGFK